jgi:hypothetical protein
MEALDSMKTRMPSGFPEMVSLSIRAELLSRTFIPTCELFSTEPPERRSLEVART